MGLRGAHAQCSTADMAIQRTTRRQVLVGTSAFGIGAGIIGSWSEAVAQNNRPRISLETFTRDKGKVEALKRGVAAMKARRPSDPTSWFYQACIHGVPNDFISEARRRDPGIGQVDRKFWNQCTHFRNAS